MLLRCSILLVFFIFLFLSKWFYPSERVSAVECNLTLAPQSQGFSRHFQPHSPESCSIYSEQGCQLFLVNARNFGWACFVLKDLIRFGSSCSWWSGYCWSSGVSEWSHGHSGSAFGPSLISILRLGSFLSTKEIAELIKRTNKPSKPKMIISESKVSCCDLAGRLLCQVLVRFRTITPAAACSTTLLPAATADMGGLIKMLVRELWAPLVATRQQKGLHHCNDRILPVMRKILR